MSISAIFSSMVVPVLLQSFASAHVSNRKQEESDRHKNENQVSQFNLLRCLAVLPAALNP
jgi:hypothetical protein